MATIKRYTFLASLAILSSCASPGEGPKANAGYKAAEPAIKAIDAYFHLNSAYPSSLEELVPRFISDNDLIVVMPGKKTVPLTYRQADDGFELSFSYVGPGTNKCVYQSKNRTWTCHGAY